MTRVAAAFNTSNPGTRSLFNETEAVATRLGWNALPLDIHFPDGVEPAFAKRFDFGRAVSSSSPTAQQSCTEPSPDLSRSNITWRRSSPTRPHSVSRSRHRCSSVRTDVIQ